MLVSFSVENWMSFRDEITFSMVASRERQHGERVARVPRYQTRVVPIAALYGGNASGKSNLFKAMAFARSFVVNGTQPDNLIPVEPFRLSTASQNIPTRFCFELLIDERMYEFSFAVTREAVVEERLVQINPASERVLYERRSDGEFVLDGRKNKNQFLQFAFQGTRENQLFLTNAVSQRVEQFKPVYDWFKHTLVLVSPDSQWVSFEQFLDENHPHHALTNQMLSQLDTGITQLAGETVALENVSLPQELKNRLHEEVKEDTAVRLFNQESSERFFITRQKGELVTNRLVTHHPADNAQGYERFEMHQESDGTQRLIDLLPAFLDLADTDAGKFYVIDEIDRSLHTLLTRQLLELYLARCSTSSRNQLLLTTHDVLLMDQTLFRRDEMWVTERGANGACDLRAFSEYKDVRYDKNIRKSYMQGRLGGIPRFSPGDVLSIAEDNAQYHG